MTEKKKPAYHAYAVIRYRKDDKAYWNRIGVGWDNKDGSINVQLNALPIDGRINLRVPKPKDEEDEGAEEEVVEDVVEDEDLPF